MNVVFLSLVDIRDIQQSGIYEDLLREFIKHGHDVYIVSPTEKKNSESTHLIQGEHFCILKVRTGNIQKVNVIEKGMSTVLLQNQLIRGIQKYFYNISFDLVLYSSPPVTFAKVVEFIKRRDQARSYLLLKDILPDAAVDIGVLKKTGVMGIAYKYFRAKERKLYAVSDSIGCMSEANIKYLLQHNTDIADKIVELCPNAIEPRDMECFNGQRYAIREKYHIPHDRTVFVYGGNLGKPQGIPFLIECLKSQKDNKKTFFVIVGSGTEFAKLKKYVEEGKQENVLLLSSLPKNEYDCMICACDIGLIFLDYRFRVPNFPSRLLSYMQAGLPVLACTDPSTDIGNVIVDGGFGWWCPSNDVKKFENCVADCCKADRQKMGNKGRTHLIEHYNTKICYEIIMGKKSER